MRFRRAHIAIEFRPPHTIISNRNPHQLRRSSEPLHSVRFFTVTSQIYTIQFMPLAL